jgi:hypothetical protein
MMPDKLQPSNTKPSSPDVWEQLAEKRKTRDPERRKRFVEKLIESVKKLGQ